MQANVVVGRVVSFDREVTKQGKEVGKLLVQYDASKHDAELQLDLFGKSLDGAPRLAPGDLVCVRYEVRSRAWQDKRFTSANAYQIDKIEAPQPAASRKQVQDFATDDFDRF